MQLPTLRQLEYFSALAETLNFREAAEASQVSQPGLSGQIAQLESILHGKLFERDRKQVRMTRLGETLLPKAREVLANAADLADLARSMGAPLSGPLRLGTIPTVGPYLLPKILPAVRRTYPELSMYLREDLTPHLLDQLEHGDLDLLLLAIDVPLGDVDTMPLFSDPFSVLVPKGHAFTSEPEVRLEQLYQVDVLLLEEGHCLGDQTMALCKAPNQSDIAAFRSSSLSTIVQMVAGGLGITLLPEMALEREVSTTPNLTTVPFPPDGPYRQIGLAWRKSSPRAAEFKMIGETMTQAYAQS